MTHQRRSKASATVATIQLVTAILQCNIKYVMFLWDQYKHARVDNSREGINIIYYYYLLVQGISLSKLKAIGMSGKSVPL